jgi:sulfite exporter TauE/SafE
MALTYPLLITGLLAGLFGSLHCLGMCGGLVAAFSMPSSKTMRQPNATALSRMADVSLLQRHAGRLLGYALLGALSGGLGAATQVLSQLLPVQQALYLLAQCMMLALGLYVMGYTGLLAPIERGGALLWQRLQPRFALHLPAARADQGPGIGSRLLSGLLWGLLWGLMPCGMVYAMLATALVSGGALQGALLMLAFGLGTLPMLLAAGATLKHLQQLRRSPWARRIAGAVLIGFALQGLLQWMGGFHGLLETLGCVS